MLLNYKDHKNIKEIQSLVKNKKDKSLDYNKRIKHERKILDRLKDFRYKTLDSKVLNEIVDYLISSDEDWCQDYKFDDKIFTISKNQKGISFMDFFTRRLNPKLESEISKSAKKCKMIIPNECHIESIGEFDKEGTPDNQILRLKKESGKLATTDLKHLDIDVTGYNYINMKLLVTFYHRIHCAVSGKIVQMIPIEGTDDFFGKNSLWIVEYQSDKFKYPVYHMLVGESSIQDFDFLKEKGEEVEIYDTLGFFNWGSQTVLLYHPHDFEEIKIQIDDDKERHHHFVGECIFK
jgi:hypothetical protein